MIPTGRCVKCSLCQMQMGTSDFCYAKGPCKFRRKIRALDSEELRARCESKPVCPECGRYVSYDVVWGKRVLVCSECGAISEIKSKTENADNANRAQTETKENAMKKTKRPRQKSKQKKNWRASISGNVFCPNCKTMLKVGRTIVSCPSCDYIATVQHYIEENPDVPTIPPDPLSIR